MIEAEVLPAGAGPEFDGIKVKVAHVRSLGLIGAFLAMMTMLAAIRVTWKRYSILSNLQ